MRTEPPTGNEMNRLLADMKGKVLNEVGSIRPAKRRAADRIVGAVVAVVLLLGAGSAGAAFALGILPGSPTEHTDAAPPAQTTPAAPPPVRTFPVATAPPVFTAPTPRIDVTCDDLIDTSALTAFLGDAGTPLLGPVSRGANASPAARTTADALAVDQLGALSCDWYNGADPWSGNTDYQALSLTVLPEGLDGADRWVETYVSPDATPDTVYGHRVEGPRCVVAIGHCDLSGVIGSTWVELRVQGIVTGGSTDDQLLSAFREITDPLVDRLASVQIADRWSPRAPSPTAASDCAVLAPSQEIAPLTGVPDLNVAEWWDGPRIGQYSYAKDELGTHRCSMLLPGVDAGVGVIGILPNGAWAIAEYGDDWLASGGRTIELPAATGGTAISRCEDESSVCRLDFAVDDDWVSVFTSRHMAPGGEFDSTPYDTTRANIEEIASIVAEHVASLSK